MEIEYSLVTDDKLSKSYILLNGENPIGSVEGYLNEYGVLTTVIKVDPEYHNQGIGFNAFVRIFDELNKKLPITKIMGSWHGDDEFAYCENGMSTNLRLFLNCVRNGNDATECALATPTGIWASRLGFKKCKVVSYGPSEAKVEFTI